MTDLGMKIFKCITILLLIIVMIGSLTRKRGATEKGWFWFDVLTGAGTIPAFIYLSWI